ncbi:MAG: multidrug effflux MFS transporter [Bacteroidetes bacterium]|nr:multidrug effflux MFS transporter [Bacteroidota bacterium]
MNIKNRGAIIFTLGALSALGPFSIDMYLPGFPSIADHLHTSIEKVQLSLTSYFIGISAGQLFFGPIIDRFGRKKPLFAGLTIYIVASLGCMLSPSVEVLIGLRFLQALGSCAGAVVSRAMVRDIFPLNENAKIFSMLILVVAISPIVAPTAGGYMSGAFGWQSIFLTLAILSVIILFLAYKFLPESKPADPGMSLHPQKILSDFKYVLQTKQFILYVVAAGFSSAGMFAYISGSPFVFIEIFHVDPKHYGWFFAFNASGLIIASQVNRILLAKRTSEDIISVTSIIQVLSGVILFLLAYSGIIGLAGMVFLLFTYLTMQGFLFPNTSALSLAPFHTRTGIASSLMGCVQMFFSAAASAAVSLLHNGTALPMAAVIACCAVLSFTFISMALKHTKEKAKTEAVLEQVPVD